MNLIFMPYIYDMAIKPSSDLFRLIKSMSSSEKRHFSINATLYERESGKIYLRLFDILDKMEVYDEEKAKKKLDSSQYPVVKVRLFQLLLRVLGNFAAEKNYDAFIRDQLVQGAILTDRGLMDSSRRILDKAYLKAMESGKYEIALEALRLVQRNDLSVVDLAVYFEKEKEIIFRIQRVSELRRISRILENRYFSNGVVRDLSQLEELDEYLRNHVVRSFEDCNDIEYVFWYHNLMSWYFMNAGIYERAHDHIVAIQIRLQLKPTSEDDFSFREKKIKMNLLYIRCCISLNRFIEAGFGIAELEQVVLMNNELADFLALGLDFHLRRGETELAEVFSEKAERLLSKSLDDEFSNNYYHLFFQVACYHFMRGNYKLAIKYSDPILATREVCKCSDYFPAFQLQILSHYEAGKTDIVNSLCRAFSRKTTNCKDSLTAESLFLIMMRKLNSLTKRNKDRLFLEFQQGFKNYLEDSFHKEYVRKTYLCEWVESKISGRSLASLLRERSLHPEPH